jgi:ABC-type amino acid transport substrate-binding protein
MPRRDGHGESTNEVEIHQQKVKFGIRRSFPLASGGLGGFILVGQPNATLNTLVRGEWPRLVSLREVAGPEIWDATESRQRAEKPTNRKEDRTRNMNEIVEILQQRAGLSPDQAQEVAKAIVDLIKSKVPSEFQPMVDQYLGGSGDAQASSSGLGALGGLLGAAEGMFGNKG